MITVGNMETVVFLTSLAGASVRCWHLHPDSILKHPFLCLGVLKDELDPTYKFPFTCVILSNRIVMTHWDACFHKDTPKSRIRIESVSVGVGHQKHTPDDSKTVYEVEEMEMHPGFNEKNKAFQRGLCLLKLKGPNMYFNERVQKAVLPPQGTNQTTAKTDRPTKLFISSYGGRYAYIRDVMPEIAVHSQMTYKGPSCHLKLNNFFHLECRPRDTCFKFPIINRYLGSPVWDASHFVVGMLGKHYAASCPHFVVEISWFRDWIDKTIDRWRAA